MRKVATARIASSATAVARCAAESQTGNVSASEWFAKNVSKPPVGGALLKIFVLCAY